MKRGPKPGTPGARRGGETVAQKYGPAYYAELGAMGGEKVKATHSSAYYAEIGRKGGLATSERHGAVYFSKISREKADPTRPAPKRRRTSFTARSLAEALSAVAPQVSPDAWALIEADCEALRQAVTSDAQPSLAGERVMAQLMAVVASERERRSKE